MSDFDIFAITFAIVAWLVVLVMRLLEGPRR